MQITTVELAFRLLVVLFVIVATPLSFVLMFRTMDYFANDRLVAQFRGQHAGMDTGQLNAYFEQSTANATVCSICGATNGENYTYCHTCQERLPK